MDARVAALAALLQETGSAHHAAFAATDGHDPEWPDWYADYLAPRLEAHYGWRIARPELAELLRRLDSQHRGAAQEADWTEYYAPRIVAQRDARNG